MATNDQITRIKHLTKILNKYRDEYYNESRPSVDDSTYDSMMDELKELNEFRKQIYQPCKEVLDCRLVAKRISKLFQ